MERFPLVANETHTRRTSTDCVTQRISLYVYICVYIQTSTHKHNNIFPYTLLPAGGQTSLKLPIAVAVMTRTTTTTPTMTMRTSTTMVMDVMVVMMMMTTETMMTTMLTKTKKRRPTFDAQGGPGYRN